MLAKLVSVALAATSASAFAPPARAAGDAATRRAAPLRASSSLIASDAMLAEALPKLARRNLAHAALRGVYDETLATLSALGYGNPSENYLSSMSSAAGPAAASRERNFYTSRGYETEAKPGKLSAPSERARALRAGVRPSELDERHRGLFRDERRDERDRRSAPRGQQNSVPISELSHSGRNGGGYAPTASRRARARAVAKRDQVSLVPKQRKPESEWQHHAVPIAENALPLPAAYAYPAGRRGRVQDAFLHDERERARARSHAQHHAVPIAELSYAQPLYAAGRRGRAGARRAPSEDYAYAAASRGERGSSVFSAKNGVPLGTTRPREADLIADRSRLAHPQERYAVSRRVGGYAGTIAEHSLLHDERLRARSISDHHTVPISELTGNYGGGYATGRRMRGRLSSSQGQALLHWHDERDRRRVAQHHGVPISELTGSYGGGYAASRRMRMRGRAGARFASAPGDYLSAVDPAAAHEYGYGAYGRRASGHGRMLGENPPRWNRGLGSMTGTGDAPGSSWANSVVPSSMTRELPRDVSEMSHTAPVSAGYALLDW